MRGMTLYTRHQLLLVLLIVGATGAGLAIDHWRRASPDLVERLERADRAERAASESSAREPRRAARPPREPRRATRPSTGAADEIRAASGRQSREASPRGRRTRGATPSPDGEEAASRAPLDVNRASVPELTRLPGIGPTLAERIVQTRPFETLDDLVRVRGLRPRLLAHLRPLLAVTP